jgi:threonine dehydratase
MTDALVPTRSQLRETHTRIAAHVRRTPTIETDGLVLKLEQLQHAGSFKTRGAFNGVLTPETLPRRLVAASGGNHGLAVAYVGRTLGIPTDIFVPEIAAPVKVAAIRHHGATVHVGGANYAEALAASAELAAAGHALVLHAYDGPQTLAGQGTLALELEEQHPEVDAVVVAVGGGGLVGGIAAWYADRARIVAVEPTGCPALHDALAVGHPVPAPVGGIAADALGASVVGERGLAAVLAADATSVLVEDAAIAEARQWLWDELRLVAEPAGATALAAVRSGAWVPDADARVAVVVCGGNTDPTDLMRG